LTDPKHQLKTVEKIREIQTQKPGNSAPCPTAGLSSNNRPIQPNMTSSNNSSLGLGYQYPNSNPSGDGSSNLSTAQQQLLQHSGPVKYAGRVQDMKIVGLPFYDTLKVFNILDKILFYINLYIFVL
jgi:hypothetical protein